MSFWTGSACAGLVAVVVLASGAASADDKKADPKQVCKDAYGKAQTLRDQHQLRGAREQLRVCSQPACAAFIVKDCTDWLVETEARVPSVVLSAKDARGQTLADASVAIDDAPAIPLNGESVEVDPGQHTFTFVAADGTKVQQPFAVLEGQKAQPIAVTIPTPASLAALQAEKAQTDRSHDGSGHGWSTLRTAGVVAGGAGVVGMALGAIFGALATSAASKQKTDCASATSCTNHKDALSDHSTAVTDGAVSTVGLIAGGALIAGGVTLFWSGAGITARSARRSSSCRASDRRAPGHRSE